MDKQVISARTIANCWEDQENGFPNKFFKAFQDLVLKLNILLRNP